MAIASLGGATLDNEENYLIKKLFTLLVGAQFGRHLRPRGGDNAPMGSGQFGLDHRDGANMAENHPVAFRFVLQAKDKGATIIHVDPRFTRTSALADIYAPIRAGSDSAFLGGLTIQDRVSYLICSFKNAVPGLDPGIHVLEIETTSPKEGVDAHGSSPWAEGPRGQARPQRL